MPFSSIIVLFATGLALFAAGSPLGGIFLVLGTVAASLKLGMPVVKHPPRPRDDRFNTHAGDGGSRRV